MAVAQSCSLRRLSSSVTKWGAPPTRRWPPLHGSRKHPPWHPAASSEGLDATFNQWGSRNSRSSRLRTSPDWAQSCSPSWLATWRNPAPPPTPVQRAAPKLGRNEACHCGSSKKNKKCCLGKQEAHSNGGMPRRLGRYTISTPARLAISLASDSNAAYASFTVVAWLPMAPSAALRSNTGLRASRESGSKLRKCRSSARR